MFKLDEESLGKISSTSIIVEGDEDEEQLERPAVSLGRFGPGVSGF